MQIQAYGRVARVWGAQGSFAPGFAADISLKLTDCPDLHFDRRLSLAVESRGWVRHRMKLASMQENQSCQRDAVIGVCRHMDIFAHLTNLQLRLTAPSGPPGASLLQLANK